MPKPPSKLHLSKYSTVDAYLPIAVDILAISELYRGVTLRLHDNVSALDVRLEPLHLTGDPRDAFAMHRGRQWMVPNLGGLRFWT